MILERRRSETPNPNSELRDSLKFERCFVLKTIDEVDLRDFLNSLIFSVRLFSMFMGYYCVKVYESSKFICLIKFPFLKGIFGLLFFSIDLESCSAKVSLLVELLIFAKLTLVAVVLYRSIEL